MVSENKIQEYQEKPDLETAKKHLNLDDSFNDDDSYITLLIQAAEDAVSKHIDKPLVELEDS